MVVLGIETSCDETAAAVVENGRLKSNIIYSQEIHNKYGGVVPEIASREHLQNLMPVVDEAIQTSGLSFSDLDGIAVTRGPGLVGSLLIGISYAKSLAFSLNLPIKGVHHIEAHLWAPAIQFTELQPPFIGLIVSGGHTQLWLVKDLNDYTLLGQTIDDAVGEAFDKTAQLLGLDYPGGPLIDKLSKAGDPEYHEFPRSQIHKDNFDFSFSGLKTSVLYFLRSLNAEEVEKNKANIAASFQQAIIDVLAKKSFAAMDKYNIKTLVLGGGVAANSALKKAIMQKAADENVRAYFPATEYCTDNAAMIAYLGYLKYLRAPESDNLYFPASPSLKIESD